MQGFYRRMFLIDEQRYVFDTLLNGQLVQGFHDWCDRIDLYYKDKSQAALFRTSCSWDIMQLFAP